MTVVLSAVVMHHPARGDVSGLVAACAPLDVRVVEDPEPDGPPSPLRTARRAWAAVAPGATHHLVLQDDVTPVPGFAALVERAVAARDRHAVALYSNWNSPRNAYLVRAAAVAGQAWAPLGHDEWVPTLALVLPADGARALAAYLDTLPDDLRDDDEAVVDFCAREGYPVVATLPHVVEHGDGPSLAGNDAHGARHATVPPVGPVDPDAWDAPSPGTTPSRTPATRRPVAVTLQGSRCALRVLRPAVGEPLEHPFDWEWRRWSGWLGADPALVGTEVRRLVAMAPASLAAVPPAACAELAAACWLLGYDVARTAWPAAVAAQPGAQREAAVRTWVLSGLDPADRGDAPVDDLVAVGLVALAAGEARGRAAGAGSPAGDPDDADPGTADADLLAAVRRLAVADAETVCRAAPGEAPRVLAVVHDCVACGVRAGAALGDLAARHALDGAVEHVVAPDSGHLGAPVPADGRAVVELLACERVPPRAVLGVDPEVGYVTRALWAAGRPDDDVADLVHALDALGQGPRVLAVPSDEGLGLPHAHDPAGLLPRLGAAYDRARLARAEELL
ncbi:hypothetical protein [Cellulosimicrobium marinum]|uniref:hypothetical protein n=1 Tax=Cellulosimicrobium marinum TaxID=1638992 RepID=UPI001E2EC550|nr:hypothetical protein [Cellulosimicrobium marinum]MCB7135526.1 hypothetical protein [Cellulosimicrobium marinum]